MSRFHRFVLARVAAAVVLSASAHSAAQTPEPAPVSTPLPMPVWRNPYAPADSADDTDDAAELRPHWQLGKGLVTAGAITLGALVFCQPIAALFSVDGAFTSGDTGQFLLRQTPVVGPFVTASDSKDPLGKQVMIALGTGQLLGLVALGTGIALQHTSPTRAKPHATLTPMLAKGHLGLGVSGSF